MPRAGTRKNRRDASTISEDAGFEKESELLARVRDLRVGEIGVDKHKAVFAEGVGLQGFFFCAERRRALGGEAGLEFFGFFLRAAVIGVDVEQTTVRAVGPSEEGIGAAIKRVEEPDFVGVFREAAAIEDARDHTIAAAMTGKNDPAHREVLRFKISAGAERGDDLGHEAFETIGVLEFAAERIGRVVRAFRDDENRVLAAGDELFDEVKRAERGGDGVGPAVEMNDKVQRRTGAETVWNKKRDGVVGVVVFGREVPTLVGVARRAVRVGERCGGEGGEDELALRGKGCFEAGRSVGD